MRLRRRRTQLVKAEDPYLRRYVETARARLATVCQAVRDHQGDQDVADAVLALLEGVQRNLDSAYVGVTIADRLASERHENLVELLRSDATTLEHVGMSLALEDTKTALNLCVTAAQAYFCPSWRLEERFPSLPDGFRWAALIGDAQRPVEWLPQLLVEWLQALHGAINKGLDLLGPWRDALDHRIYRWIGADLDGTPGETRRWLYPRVARRDTAPSRTRDLLVPDDLATIVTLAAAQITDFYDALGAAIRV